MNIDDETSGKPLAVRFSKEAKQDHLRICKALGIASPDVIRNSAQNYLGLLQVRDYLNRLIHAIPNQTASTLTSCNSVVPIMPEQDELKQVV